MNNSVSNEILRRDAALCTSRRAFLAGAGAMVVWANAPRFAFAGNRDPRLIVVVLRGAVDGLAMVPPVGDPHYRALRGDLAIGADGAGPRFRWTDISRAEPDAMPDFMPSTGRGTGGDRSGRGDFPYRERSHFDGQDVLESGDGWTGRGRKAAG